MNYTRRFFGYAVGLLIAATVLHFMTRGEKLRPFELFRCEEGRFSVLMPGKPQREAQSVETGAGTVELVMFTAGHSRTGCAAAFVDYPDEAVAAATAETMLDSRRDSTIAGLGGELVGEASFDFHGHKGREFRIKVKDEMTVTARLILVNRRLYQLMFIMPADGTPGDEVTRFFESFTADDT